MPLEQTVSCLQYCFFMGRSIFDEINIGNNSGESLYPGKNLRPSLERILEILDPLKISFGVTLNKTLSTN